jgi:hypothetical protein
MSSRYLKSLKLNGVIVGEYLGSDDQDEDVEAARDMLRAKSLYSPPSLPSAMLGQANAFAYVANATYMDLMKNRGLNKPIIAAPFVVNSAFSVELYLKTLHLVATGSNAREHGHTLMSDEVFNFLERLKQLGQTQGFLTHAQVNEQTPPAIVDPEEIADIVRSWSVREFE